jgi:hypothetical protein
MGIKIEKVSKREYRLLEDVVVSTLGYRITVKQGLVFDGASIPKVFWNIIGSPFTGAYTLPALVHDCLYMSEAVERKTADAIFLDLMKQQGVSWLKRNIMYRAVRVGGMFVWNSHKPETVLENKQYIRIENGLD